MKAVHDCFKKFRSRCCHAHVLHLFRAHCLSKCNSLCTIVITVKTFRKQVGGHSGLHAALVLLTHHDSLFSFLNCVPGSGTMIWHVTAHGPCRESETGEKRCYAKQPAMVQYAVISSSDNRFAFARSSLLRQRISALSSTPSINKLSDLPGASVSPTPARALGPSSATLHLLCEAYPKNWATMASQAISRFLKDLKSTRGKMA